MPPGYWTTRGRRGDLVAVEELAAARIFHERLEIVAAGIGDAQLRLDARLAGDVLE